MKRIALLLAAILVIVSAGAATRLEFTEGDLINLRPLAEDGDQDDLTYFFAPPLSARGVWQTDLGDAGEYTTKVTVSDGRVTSTEQITLVVHKDEQHPQITDAQPETDTLVVEEGTTLTFTVAARDPNRDPIATAWFVDDEQAGEGNLFSYTLGFDDAGTHLVEARVSDQAGQTARLWTVEVEDFDRASLLDDIVSTAVTETGLIDLDLPAFDRYGLEYAIEGPLDNQGRWLTSYDDAGVYDVTIVIWDGEDFRAEKTIKLLVEDLDRPAEPDFDATWWAGEGMEIVIPIVFIDPDGQDIAVAVEGLPEGAVFDGGAIVWTPPYDLISQADTLDSLARGYGVLSTRVEMTAVARSGTYTVEQPIIVRVFDSNRPPVIESVEKVVVTEGERLSIDVEASDPDGDDLDVTIDRFIVGQRMARDDVGEYVLEVEVSDGFASAVALAEVSVLPRNEPPRFRAPGAQTVREGQWLEIPLDASDPDGDDLIVEVSPDFPGAYVKGLTYHYRPPFDAQRAVQLTIGVSDGQLVAEHIVPVTIADVNRPPVITATSLIGGKVFDVGEAVVLSVDARDPDGDELTYSWKTGLLSRRQGEDDITLVYDRGGTKTVSVQVSDGEETVEHEWEFEVEAKRHLRITTLK